MKRFHTVAYFGPMRAAVSLLALSSLLPAAELKPETIKAWDEYVKAAHTRALARLGNDCQVLPIDKDSEEVQQVRQGEILVSPTHGPGMHRIPGGLIHDWMGTVFIPNATIPEVLSVLRDYNRYKDVYRPATVEAKLISRDGNVDTFSAILTKKVLFVTSTIEGEYQSRYNRLSPDCWTSVSYSTQIRDIENFGQSTERKLPANHGSGFLWRARTFSRYLQRDGGVYLELEGLVLTRDVPFIWRWLVNPIIEDLSKATIQASLRETRDAVLSRVESSNTGQ